MTSYEAMKADTNVLSHIRACNEARATEARENGWTFHFMMAEDMASEYATVYDFEREMAFSSYSDCYKDEYGCRPRFDREPTLEELEALLEAL